MIVDGDHRLALQRAHHARQALVLLPGKLDPVPFRLPIRRIEVEQRAWPVVACVRANVLTTVDAHRTNLA